MRSNKYDSLPLTVDQLKEKIKQENRKTDAFQKSNVNDGNFSKTVESFAASCVETSGHAKQVFEQFKILKSDFQSNKINRAMYKDALKPLYSLLTGMGQRIEILGFDASEIAQELKIVGY